MVYIADELIKAAQHAQAATQEPPPKMVMIKRTDLEELTRLVISLTSRLACLEMAVNAVRSEVQMSRMPQVVLQPPPHLEPKPLEQWPLGPSVTTCKSIEALEYKDALGCQGKTVSSDFLILNHRG